MIDQSQRVGGIRAFVTVLCWSAIAVPAPAAPALPADVMADIVDSAVETAEGSARQLKHPKIRWSKPPPSPPPPRTPRPRAEVP